MKSEHSTRLFVVAGIMLGDILFRYKKAATAWATTIMESVS